MYNDVLTVKNVLYYSIYYITYVAFSVLTSIGDTQRTTYDAKDAQPPTTETHPEHFVLR